MNSQPRSGEFELIAKYFAPLAADGAFGLTDDAALLRVAAGGELVVTQDAIAAGVHFFASDPPGAIAQKALRVNLSDLAAKGATPKSFSLALGLPADWREEWLAAFAAGLAADCRKYGVALTGGDTFVSPGGLVVSITAFGEVAAGHYRARSGARPGDRLFVTGTIGDAALGLKVRQGDTALRAVSGARDLLYRYLLPDPPVAFAPIIAAHANGAMDISDGFLGDIAKLARAARLDFAVRLQHVPFSGAVMSAIELPDALQTALTGGDDYQLLFAAPVKNLQELRRAMNRAGLDATEIAVARAGTGKVTLLDAAGEPMRFERAAFEHFGIGRHDAIS